jgi:hypothetical protein
VLRELEGLSYKDIGDRMGLSRPAVESTLFRARKRLGEEYEELASGARCLRVQAIVEDGSRLGVRERRNLARHVSHCQPCRQLAVRAGLDVPVPARRRLAEKLAGLLPLPAVLRWRRGGGEEATTAFGGGGGTWMTHVPMLTDSMSTGWNKAAAGLAALVLAGAGVGATTMTVSEKRDERGTGYRATDVRTESNGGNAAPTPPRRAAVPAADGPAKATRRGGRSKSTTASSSDRRGAAKARRGDGGKAGSGEQRAAGGGAPAASGGGAPDAAGGGGRDATGGGTDASGGGRDPVDARSPGNSAPTRAIPRTDAPKPPSVEAPAAPAPSVGETTKPVTEAVPDPAQVVPAPPAVPKLPVTVPDPEQVVPAPPAPVDDPVGGVDLP